MRSESDQETLHSSTSQSKTVSVYSQDTAETAKTQANSWTYDEKPGTVKPYYAPVELNNTQDSSNAQPKKPFRRHLRHLSFFRNYYYLCIVTALSTAIPILVLVVLLSGVTSNVGLAQLYYAKLVLGPSMVQARQDEMANATAPDANVVLFYLNSVCTTYSEYSSGSNTSVVDIDFTKLTCHGRRFASLVDLTGEFGLGQSCVKDHQAQFNVNILVTAVVYTIAMILFGILWLWNVLRWFPRSNKWVNCDCALFFLLVPLAGGVITLCSGSVMLTSNLKDTIAASFSDCAETGVAVTGPLNKLKQITYAAAALSAVLFPVLVVMGFVTDGRKRRRGVQV